MTETGNLPKAARAILAAGITAGVFDLTAACVTWGVRTGARPPRIMQSIASGLLGRNAYSDGWKSAVLGLILHFLIALAAAAVFYLASRKMSWLTLRPFISGTLYGLAVYVVMNHVVVPLSAFPGRRGFPSPLMLSIALLTHIFCVGLPISLWIRRYSEKN